ncbi:hypothetical protein J3458_007273 [Metarhizium acridum]|uniref:uncharacterized protein n=1 Tax=Metarhizium acridum TaxID=92637 RepID=UPI001C6C09DB|nr:hypothetical protein J3458_007273 [Metarhizium acridum]
MTRKIPPPRFLETRYIHADVQWRTTIHWLLCKRLHEEADSQATYMLKHARLAKTHELSALMAKRGRSAHYQVDKLACCNKGTKRKKNSGNIASQALEVTASRRQGGV